jgi:hypothetical protein
MLNRIDHNAIAAFVLDHADYSELYEDDCFTVEVKGQRFYVERKKTLFVLHIGQERIKLPRA